MAYPAPASCTRASVEERRVKVFLANLLGVMGVRFASPVPPAAELVQTEKRAYRVND